MIDFHSHILPGIDDGSKDIRMTEEMLKEEAAQGITTVCATPHFYAHRKSIPQFLENREASLAQVQALLAERDGLPEITVGAEVFYFAGMGRAEQLKKLCLGETDILLLEMPFDQWTPQILDDVRQIITHQHLRIVLAHIERYYGLQRQKKIWHEVLALPVMIQLNAGSFSEGGRGRRFCLKTLQEEAGRVIIGSDCHNITSRKPNIAEALNVIGKKCGGGQTERLQEVARDFLGIKKKRKNIYD